MNKPRRIDLALRGALGVLAVAFIAAVGYAVYVPPEHVVVAGEQAPPFSISSDTGRTVSVPGFEGKLLVLNFWATWCPPCVEETPSLSQFAQDFAGRGVVVMAISVDTNQKAYDDFLRKFKPLFLTARDAFIHRQYGTFVYPESYIIDSSGKVVYKIPEGADWSSANLRSYITSLL
jgi:cytochrome c biogenesis protein CcmG, thiol:disulfide interchange protein DsbE